MSTQDTQTEMKKHLLAALDLMDFSICLMRQNIARKLPEASPEQIDAELHRWIFEQPKNFVIGATSYNRLST